MLGIILGIYPKGSSIPDMPPTASVELLSVAFPAVIFPVIVALSVACATTDVIAVVPVVVRVIADAKMAIVANIVNVFI
jgi:hypothetical protein